MTPKDARILGYAAFLFGIAFGVIHNELAAWISLVLLLCVAFPCLAYVVWDDLTGKGPKGPLGLA